MSGASISSSPAGKPISGPQEPRLESNPHLRDGDELAVLLKALPLPAFILRNQCIVDINAPGANLLRCPASSLINRDFTSFLEAADCRAFNDALTALLDGAAELKGLDVKIVDGDGRRRWIQLSASLLILHDGPSALASAVDITQAKLAVDSLECYSGALAHTADAVMITDRQGVIQFINSSFTAMTGFRPNEIIGQTPRLLKSGSHPPEFFRAMWGEILAGRVFRAVFRNRRKDGSFFYMEQTISPVGEAGDISHFVSTARDVTDQILKQEERVRRERLAVLGEAIAGISHSVKGIVSRMDCSINLMDEALMAGNTARINELWPIFQRSIHELSRLTVDMLAYAADRRAERELASLNEIAWQVVEICRPDADKKSITLEFQAVEDLPPAWMEKSAVSCLVFNLVDNALQACDSVGGGVVSLVSIFDDEEESVSLRVIDSGPGVPEELRERIFDPFFSTKGPKGHGLGLAGVKKIVNRHGGAVSLESRPGRTCFEITFPLGSADSPNQP